MKTISCKEAVNFILKKEEKKLSLGERITLWRHLAVYSLCKTFSVQNKLMNDAMKQRETKQLALSEEEKENIIRNVLDGKSK